VRGPQVFAVLAILLATAPFLVLGTVLTAFSRPLVITYGLAVLSSMLVAVTLTPTLAAMLLRSRAAGHRGPFAGWAERMFDGGALPRCSGRQPSGPPAGSGWPR